MIGQFRPRVVTPCHKAQFALKSKYISVVAALWRWVVGGGWIRSGTAATSAFHNV